MKVQVTKSYNRSCKRYLKIDNSKRRDPCDFRWLSTFFWVGGETNISPCKRSPPECLRSLDCRMVSWLTKSQMGFVDVCIYSCNICNPKIWEDRAVLLGESWWDIFTSVSFLVQVLKMQMCLIQLPSTKVLAIYQKKICKIWRLPLNSFLVSKWNNSPRSCILKLYFFLNWEWQGRNVKFPMLNPPLWAHNDHGKESRPKQLELERG